MFNAIKVNSTGFALQCFLSIDSTSIGVICLLNICVLNYSTRELFMGEISIVDNKAEKQGLELLKYWYNGSVILSIYSACGGHPSGRSCRYA